MKRQILQTAFYVSRAVLIACLILNVGNRQTLEDTIHLLFTLQTAIPQLEKRK